MNHTESGQNMTHISNENNYNYNASGNTQFPTSNSNTSYNNNYNYGNNYNYNINSNYNNFNNNYNNTTNNNSNNNNSNNNNTSSPTPGNLEIKTSDKLATNYSNVPTNNNKFEENKFCRCCYRNDLLINLDCIQKIKIISLSIIHLLLTIGDVFYTLNDIFIIHIMNFIHFIYGIFCLICLKKNKCIRYFTTVFSIIFIFAGNLAIIGEAIYLWKIGKGQPKDNKDPDSSFVTIMIAGMRACCLLALTDIMLFIFCDTCCKEHNCRMGDDNHINLVHYY